MNREEGFFGTGLKKDEYVCDCSDIDEVITFRKDGTFIVNKVADKVFAGKDIIHIAVFKRNDTRTIYNCVYFDGQTGHTMMKRSPVTGITRDKEYSFIKEHKNSKILYMTANPNGEAEVIKVYLKPRPRLKALVLEMDFSELSIKGKASQGNILTKYGVHKIVMKEKGISTLGGRKVWWDEVVMRLNADGRGKFLGEFVGSDQILVVTKSGVFRTTNFDLSNHYEDNILLIEKFRPEKIFSASYFDAEQNYYYVKRFTLEESEKSQSIIGDHPESRLIQLSEVEYPRLEVRFGGKNKGRDPEIIEVADFIGVKSFKAKGKRLSTYEVSIIKELEPLMREAPPAPEPELPDNSPPEMDGPVTGSQMSLDL